MTQQQVRLAIIFLLAIVSFGLVVFDAVVGKTDPPILATLLGVVLGFIGSQTSAQQGADHANMVPPTTSASPPEGESQTTKI